MTLVQKHTHRDQTEINGKERCWISFWTARVYTFPAGKLGIGRTKLEAAYSVNVTGGAGTPNGRLENCKCLRQPILTLTLMYAG